MTAATKPKEVLAAALDVFHQKPSWVVFFRNILGQNGIVRRLYPTPAALAEFEKTDEYAEIQAMLTRLRADGEVLDAAEPCRVITVRMPKSMHEALKTEAYAYQTSMNQLCISKLLQIVDGDLVPAENKGKKAKSESDPAARSKSA